ncbi:hypothetical protein AB4Y36_38325 [Paraburkholderia sp. BR10936]|uniref:hypothetical protein n=1 Tax=Paraburkholderia sp. BR10936 TaxID=3236993 RepID=UPI0034D15A72
MRGLRISSKGYPVPFFVGYINGEPDFRCIDPQKLRRCMRESRCWLCGHKLGIYRTYVIGPMCIVNRVSSEPPSHFDCARFAAQACPFLTLPHAHRREANMPSKAHAPPGIAITRNPGVVALWTTPYPHKLMRAPDGVLFEVADAESVEWWSEGRTATYAEVRESFDSGVEILRRVAAQQGPRALAALEWQVTRAFGWLPMAA